MTKYVIYCKKNNSKLLNIESYEKDKFCVTCTENIELANKFDFLSIALFVKDAIQEQYKVDYLDYKVIETN